MVARSYTVAFEGVEARLVEVQCAVAPGMPAFTVVGLPDKAVTEAKERVRAALTALSISLPSKRITINLSPADLPKEGSHFDLPIALAVMAALEMIPKDETERTLALGELSLDGTLVRVAGALPSALTAAEHNLRLLCPSACGAEAAWVDAAEVIAAPDLGQAFAHFTNRRILPAASPGQASPPAGQRDMKDVKGQERAKRALEIAAAGRHHMLMMGPPGSGKSMLAARLPTILPPLTALEALETSQVHSVAGLLGEDGISRERPFRDPHHTSSMAALVGGGRHAKPGEISLAHNGVLFLDEFPEFQKPVLETLRQPVETGQIAIARANAHIRYPCRFLLLAAANPCKCGHLGDDAQECTRAPVCGADYIGRISGPLMDRFDLRVDVPAVSYQELDLPATGASSAQIASRVTAARGIQEKRYQMTECRVNADADGAVLEEMVQIEADAKDLLLRAADQFQLSARGYHRVLRVARTIADLDATDGITHTHLAEALSFRLHFAPQGQTPRIARKAAAAPQPAVMAMAKDNSP